MTMGAGGRCTCPVLGLIGVRAPGQHNDIAYVKPARCPILHKKRAARCCVLMDNCMVITYL